MNINGNSKQAIQFLEVVVGEKLSFPSMIKSIRMSDNISQADFARKLGISRQYLCDLEHGRKVISAKKSYEFAKKLGHSTQFFILMALNDELVKSKLPFNVELNLVPKKSSIKLHCSDSTQ